MDKEAEEEKESVCRSREKSEDGDEGGGDGSSGSKAFVNSGGRGISISGATRGNERRERVVARGVVGVVGTEECHWRDNNAKNINTLFSSA